MTELTRLPVDVLREVFEHAVFDTLQDTPHLAARLQLTSRVVRIWLLPHIYRAFVVHLPSDCDTQHPTFRYWLNLLYDPRSVPRRYIQHLVFVGENAKFAKTAIEKRGEPFERWYLPGAALEAHPSLLETAKLCPAAVWDARASARQCDRTGDFNFLKHVVSAPRGLEGLRVSMTLDEEWTKCMPAVRRTLQRAVAAKCDHTTNACPGTGHAPSGHVLWLELGNSIPTIAAALIGMLLQLSPELVMVLGHHSLDEPEVARVLLGDPTLSPEELRRIVVLHKALAVDSPAQYAEVVRSGVDPWRMPRF